MQPYSTSRRLKNGVPFALAVVLGFTLAATAQTSPYQPSAPQPVLPPSGGAKPTSPVVESLMDQRPPVLEVRKAHRHARHASWTHHRHFSHFRERAPVRDLERPALAGVELLQPLPRPGEPPHLNVPLPGYPLDSFITAFTTPLPPIVCHPTRRDPDVPDPRLYRERTVTCEADNP